MSCKNINVYSQHITYDYLLTLVPNPNEYFACKLCILSAQDAYYMRFNPQGKEICLFEEDKEEKYYIIILTKDNYVKLVPYYSESSLSAYNSYFSNRTLIQLNNTLVTLFNSSFSLQVQKTRVDSEFSFLQLVASEHALDMTPEEKFIKGKYYYAPYSFSYLQPLNFINPNTEEGKRIWKDQDNNLSIMKPPMLYRSLDLDFVKELHKEVFLIQQSIKARALLAFSPTLYYDTNDKVYQDKQVVYRPIIANLSILNQQSQELNNLREDVEFYVSKRLEDYKIRPSKYEFKKFGSGYGNSKVPVITLSINTFYSDLDLLTKLQSMFC